MHSLCFCSGYISINRILPSIMAVVDIQLLIQTILYFCIFLCGFFISIPIGVNKINFNGMCILYSHFSKEAHSHSKVTSSHQSNCDFPVFLGVFGCIFYGLALGVYYAFATRKSTKNSAVGSQMWVMPFMLLNSAVAVVMLVAAPMISVGFKQFCDKIIEYTHVKSCKDEQNKEWKIIGESNKFNTGYFYRLLTVAQIACWAAFFLFVLQIAFGMLRFYRNRRTRLRANDKENIATVEPTA